MLSVIYGECCNEVMELNAIILSGIFVEYSPETLTEEEGSVQLTSLY
jgi:hypothetical protein